MEITLQDVNDNPPVFPNDVLDVTIEENVGDGFRIMQLTATDADEVIAPAFLSCLTALLRFPAPVFLSPTFQIDVPGTISIKNALNVPPSKLKIFVWVQSRCPCCDALQLIWC